jgi:glycosyltransferase involved in cell wall biosynthesis
VRRIVHYYPGAMGNSGVTFALWSWARAQAASGAEVCVLHAPRARGDTTVGLDAVQERPGITVRSVPHRGRHRFALRPIRLGRYLRSNDLLVLHEGWVLSNLIAAAAARRAGVPYIVMPHGVYESLWTRYLKGPLWLRVVLERHVLERAAAVHLFFESEAVDVQRLAPAAKFMTVPTGFDVPGDQWTGGGGYLGWVGRIDPVHKGLDALVGAIARLPPADRPLLRIRGYDYKGGVTRLEQLIAERGVARWVHLEGPVVGAEKMRFMQQADGYVHPSRWECHSIALLESLALGVPCLVSNAIHIAPTLARSGAAVLAVPSERDLATALGRLHVERPWLTPRGRALIGDDFNWGRLMPQFYAALSGLGMH